MEFLNREGKKIDFNPFSGKQKRGDIILIQPGAGQTIETREEWLKRILKANCLDQPLRELAIAELAK